MLITNEKTLRDPIKHLLHEFLLLILPSDLPFGQDSNLLPPVSQLEVALQKAHLWQINLCFVVSPL